MAPAVFKFDQDFDKLNVAVNGFIGDAKADVQKLLDAIAALKARGHDMPQADRWSTDFGRAQLIYKMEDGYFAASERRTDGQAVGF